LAEVKWIKIVTDIFDDEKILLIESLPDADSIIVIWFKLLCLAGKNNNSGVFTMNDKIPYTDEMFATIFRRPLNTVRMALKVFEQYGMIEIINNIVTIPNWGKHQNLDQIEAKKEYMRKYMQEYRQKQLCKTNSKANSKTNVSQADKIRVDIDKEYIPYRDIVSYLNERVGTNYQPTSKKTQSLIKARFNEKFTLEDFKAVIDIKAAEWLGTEMQKYLRPETLFGTKFESYLNQKSAGKAEPQPSYFKPLNYEYED
jgi:uncharacterized phage protein (TIGR02220 family)/predicted phage replisome organizer